MAFITRMNTIILDCDVSMASALYCCWGLNNLWDKMKWHDNERLFCCFTSLVCLSCLFVCCRLLFFLGGGSYYFLLFLFFLFDRKRLEVLPGWHLKNWKWLRFSTITEMQYTDNVHIQHSVHMPVWHRPWFLNFPQNTSASIWGCFL